MSLTQSHEKVRKPLRGSSITTPETSKESFSAERSYSVPNLQIHSNASSVPTRSDSMNTVGFLREDSKQSSWQMHPWMNSTDSKDLGVVLEETNEESNMPTVVVGGKSRFQKEKKAIKTDASGANQPIWYEVKDIKSKKTFYFNDDTQVTQWERPENATIIPVNQRGVAIILGNGVIEKDYRSATMRLDTENNENRIYLNAEDHLYDTVHHTQKAVFKDTTPDSSRTPITDPELSPVSREEPVIFSSASESYVKFVRKNFLLYRRGIFKSKATEESVMIYKDIPIHMPLLKAASGCKQASVHLNREILKYVQMKETNSIEQRTLLTQSHSIRYIISLVMENYQQLRNEVYCQVLKTMRGSNDLIAFNAWNIMAVLCSSVCPTEELIPYLLSFFSGARSNKNFKSLPETSERLLRKTVVMQQRKEIPTDTEICAILNASEIAIRVYLVNQEYATLRIVPGTTIHELSMKMASLLGLEENGELFCMYETDGGHEERLEEEIQVLDQLAIWQRHYDECQKNHHPCATCHFVYHAEMFVEFDKSDPVMRELLFIQAVSDMWKQYYPCSDIDKITLLALFLKSKYGDDEIPSSDIDFFLSMFLPAIGRNSSQYEEMRNKSLLFVSKLKEKSREWYVNAYLEYVMSWELYGLVTFPVDPVGRTDLGLHCLLALGMHGVFILDSTTRMIQRQIPFDSVPSWSFNDDSFSVFVGTFVHQEKLLFSTHCGKAISNLLNRYVTYLSNHM